MLVVSAGVVVAVGDGAGVEVVVVGSVLAGGGVSAVGVVAGVVVVGSGVLVVLVVAVAPKAAPVSGPPRLAAVNPPPARAESTARMARRRAALIGGMRWFESSRGRPMIVVGEPDPQVAGYAHRNSYRQASRNP